MAHNFRKIGDIYVSKAGNDSNAGTNLLPKATISAGIASSGSTCVIGSGTYEESFNISKITINDGLVILKGNGSNTITLATGGSQFLANGAFFIRDYASFTCANYAGISNVGYCTFFNIPDISVGIHAVAFTNCIFVNCTINTAFQTSFTNCIFINVEITGFYTNSFYNNYVNGASIIRLDTSGTSDYNNLMGTIYMSDAVGTPYNFTGYRGIYTTRDASSFNQNPKFNNAAKMDFSLQNDSPHINSGISGSNIGGTLYSKSVTSVDAIAAGAVLTGVELFGQDIIISTSTGHTSGTILYPPQLVASNPMAIQKIDYLGLLLFNKSQSGGSATNKNVPDATVYAGSDASGGGNPDRLIIEIRTSTNAFATPSVDADYDNNGYATAGAWLKVPIGEQPQVDNFMKGNGELDFDFTSYQPIVACWVQVRITLTNLYL